MHTVMGGTCQFTAQITKLTSTQIAVQYTLYDHFGAGTKDAVSALPGLPSLYCIQRIPGTKYVPFIWSVTLTR